ncbi:YegP family protein [Candidatus Bathyarchaeota archaeon]|nr:YegP family protein [Candidatus Bathyarchaeota archaeon]
MAGSYNLKRSMDQKYYFNLVADNNEIVLTSETYNTKQNALDGISSVRLNSPHEERYKRKISTRQLHYFILTATNGEPIGTSEEYSSAQAMENGILVVKRIGQSAILRDLT